jgi:hypothetical protein
VVASHWLLDLLVHRSDMPILPANIGNLPRLGLGLWRLPDVSAAIELALVLIGGWLYWRAANRVTQAAGRGRTAAIASACSIIIFGALVLWLDFTGV